jgi:hypothetical protein
VTGTETRFYNYAVRRARFRERLYFASDSSAARGLGVSRRTIIRCRQSLERQGWLRRCGKRRCGPGKVTVCYAFTRRRVTQGSYEPNFSRRSSLRSDLRRCRAERGSPQLSTSDQMRLPDHEPSRPPGGKRTRRADVVWDAAVAVWGVPANDAERGRRARAVKLIRQSLTSDGIPETQAETEIRARQARYVEQYPHIAAPSDVGLVSRWSDCKPAIGPSDGLSAYTRA